MFKFLVILIFISWVYCEDMCGRNNTSCSYLFDEVEEDFCWKIYYDINNQSVCDAAYDETAVRSNKENYGKLILFPFHDNSFTIFNVSFVDITFKVLKIRFQEYEFKYGNKIEKCMVKDFILKGSVPTSKTFTYDCPWRTMDYEGNIVDFHYEYGLNEYETRKKYRFWVPKHEILKEDTTKLYFFTYLDYTDINNLTLNIVPAKKRFNVTQYKVDVIYTFKGESNIKASVNLTADELDLLQYSFYTSGTIGDYHFRIEPVSNYCQNNITVCEILETPKHQIVDESSSLLIGMVGVSLLIPIFMIIVYMWRKQCPKPSANVLLVTVPTNDAHVIIAPAFAEYLEEVYGVNVMLDINDVPRTFTRNSFDWLKVAINHTTHIIFLRSNDELPSARVIYQDIYIQTLHLLNPQLNPIRKKECIISFNYSSDTTEETHPALGHITNRFSFKESSNKLSSFLFNRKIVLNRTDNSAYKSLLNAIKMVEQERSVKNRNRNGFGLQFEASDDDNNDHHLTEKELLGELQNDPEIVRIDLNDFNLFGESNHELNNIKDENDCDNDLDGLNFYGK